MTKLEFLERWCSSNPILRREMGDDIDSIVHEYYTAMTSVDQVELTPNWNPTERMRWHYFNSERILQQLFVDKEGFLKWMNVPLE
jgi:hypothetical protein